MKLYERVAGLLAAIENCKKSGNAEWIARHSEKLSDLLGTHLPSGSGFDSGCSLLTGSTPEKLIFSADFHHMDDVGMYDGWTNHTVVVSPSLVHGISLRIAGKDRNGIKDYIADTFHAALSVDVV